MIYNNRGLFMENRPKVGIAAIIIRDKKVLLGKRKGSHGQGTWGLPGGHLEYGESFESCVTREIKEETSLTVTNIRFAAITNDVHEKEKKHYVTIFVTCEYIAGEAKLLEPEKCEAWEWFSWNNLPKPLFLSIINVIKQGYNPFHVVA